jgi:hypothetical protein
MNTLKMMFGGGADVAQLAEMIRRFGRGEDKILAHITPEEAAMLKEQGGSGTINPMTGLPEFQEYEGPDTPFPDYQPNYREDVLRAETAMPDQGYYGEMAQPTTYYGNQQPFTSYGDFAMQEREPSFLPPDALQEIETAEMEQRAEPSPFGRQVPVEDENIFQTGERRLGELEALLNRYPRLSRIGGAGVNVIGQALLAQRANRQRQVMADAERARAQPFRQAEAEALARARGEGLTPRQAREMEIVQARARQQLGAANQGAGSAAAGILATQQQRARSVARQESFDEALKMAGIADRYERAAIAAELAADQELAALFGNVLANEIGAATRTQAPQQAPQRRP